MTKKKQTDDLIQTLKDAGFSVRENGVEYIRAAIVMKMIADAVMAEREACAAVADAVDALRDRTADAIRKRGGRDD